jgi:hypothetical protein
VDRLSQKGRVIRTRQEVFGPKVVGVVGFIEYLMSLNLCNLVNLRVFIGASDFASPARHRGCSGEAGGQKQYVFV